MSTSSTTAPNAVPNPLSARLPIAVIGAGLIGRAKAREGDGVLGCPNEKPMTSRPLTRTLTLGPLTALALAPPQLIDVAAAAGLDGIGIRMLPAASGGIAYPMMDDAAMLRETLAAKAATGLRILDLEMVRIGPAFDVSVYAAFFDTGARLGAAHVLVAIDDADTARAAASFAQVCEALQPYGLTADLEFMPWTEAPDLTTARRIVREAAQPNGGILIDPLHLLRSRSAISDIDLVPVAQLHYAQICDGPAAAPATLEGLIHAARCERLLPGEGEIDLEQLFKHLPPGLPVCIETPSETRAPKQGWHAWVQQCATATRSVLALIDQPAT